MAFKTKLSVGLGFLFLMIFGLVFFYSYHIQKLSKESGNILKDNYLSIVYSKNMLQGLDDMQTSTSSSLFNPGAVKSTDYLSKLFESGKKIFDEDLKKENNNITEIHEREYADTLNKNYEIYLNLCDRIQKGSGSSAMYFNELVPAYEKLRQSIISISDINMQAVERKNQSTQMDAAGMIRVTAIVGSILLLLAFAYFWYFPFYISTSMSYLSGRMRGLLKSAGIAAEFKTEDEAEIILQSINLLENKLGTRH